MRGCFGGAWCRWVLNSVVFMECDLCWRRSVSIVFLLVLHIGGVRSWRVLCWNVVHSDVSVCVWTFRSPLRLFLMFRLSSTGFFFWNCVINVVLKFSGVGCLGLRSLGVVLVLDGVVPCCLCFLFFGVRWCASRLVN